MPLTDAACRNAKGRPKAYKLADAGGLYLSVTPKGSRLWRLKYRFEGREKKLSFGPYPLVDLATARAKRDAAKLVLLDGRDPGSDLPADGPAEETFRQIAAEWLRGKATNLAPNYEIRTQRQLNKDIYPFKGDGMTKPFGDLLMAQITPKIVLDMVRAIEKRGAISMARRARRHVSEVFGYAIASSRAERDPAQDMKRAMLPEPRVKHQAKMPESELPRFFGRLKDYDGAPITRLSIELLIRTWVRTKELRFAEWSEIDGDLWRIPAERMKMSRDHLVPLTPQALGLLDQLRVEGRGSRWIVPGVAGPMSENTMLFSLYRMGYHSRATIHGFRGTASTICNESGLFNKDWIERQLAHVPGDGVRSAYNAAEYLGPRRKMLEWFSDLIDAKMELSDLIG